MDPSAVLATTAALLVVVVISIATAGPKSSRDCINVTSPGFVGAQSVSGCGAQARAICHSALVGSGYTRGRTRTSSGSRQLLVPAKGDRRTPPAADPRSTSVPSRDDRPGGVPLAVPRLASGSHILNAGTEGPVPRQAAAAAHERVDIEVDRDAAGGRTSTV